MTAFAFSQLIGLNKLKQLVLCSTLLICTFLAVGQKSDDSVVGIEQQIQQHIEVSEKLLYSNPDSSLVQAKLAFNLITEVSSKKLKARTLICIGDAHMVLDDVASSLKYFLQAKMLVEDSEELMIHSEILIKIGMLNYQLQEFDKSLELYEEALRVFERADTTSSDVAYAKRKLMIYNNIAAIHLQQSDFSIALSYFQNAYETNKLIGDGVIESTLANNIGICYLEKGEHDLANHYFLKSLKFRQENSDKKGEAQVLNNIGKNEVYQGNLNLAKQYYEQALQIGKAANSKESVLISLQSLSSIHDTLGEYKGALDYFKEYKSLNDSVFNIENRAAVARLEEQYKRDRQNKIYELELQRNEAERQSVEIRNITIVGTLFFLLLTAVLLIIVMRGKMRNAKLQRENLDLEHKTLQESLDFKERELTAKALFLLKNNELITKITENLLAAKSTFKQENQKIIQDIIFELRASQDNHIWDEFEAHFTKVHSQFYQLLQDRFPNLTANEKRLCAFLRLNMSTKEISAITHQSINSITVARSRLRKKLNIEGEDIHLVNFLMEF
jgi:tetratricopeptide (TPR) repeat protein